MPKSVKRFSDNIMFKLFMMPKSVKRFSDNIMLKLLRPITFMTFGRFDQKSS